LNPLLGEVRTTSFLGAFVRAWLVVPGLSEPLIVESTVAHQGEIVAGTRLRLHVPHDRAVAIG
jgi:hypothetical protein